MLRRKSKLGPRTLGAEAIRQIITNQNVEDHSLVNKQNKQRMAQICAEEAAERHVADLRMHSYEPGNRVR